MDLSVEQTLPPKSLLTSSQKNAGSIWSFNSQQWISLVLLSVGNFGLALCSGLQAPFFPREAERKGATPAEYGLVFGLFYLTTFVSCPIFGRLMSVVGPDHLRDMGMFIVGVCFILFGSLDKAAPGATFLALAYVIRFVEGVGNAAYKTSNFPLLVAYFPNNVASVMGVLETMFGMGLIVGPTVGGLLYEIGGFTFPFVSSGSVLVFIAFLTLCALPKTEVTLTSKGKGNVLKFITDPLVACYIYLLTVSSSMIGYNLATLEPHLRQFHLDPVQVGLVFVLVGGFYGFTSIIWGQFVDRQYNPTLMACISSLLLAISFTFIGPAPILHIDSHLWLVGLSLVFLGCGYGATRVVPYVDCLKHGLERGFENNLATYGMISGIFNGTFGIGFFIGPTVGGLAVETIGYKTSAFFLGILSFLSFLFFLVYYVHDARKKKRIQKNEESPLLKEESSTKHTVEVHSEQL